MSPTNRPLFSFGQIVATPGAIGALEKSNQTPMEFLQRHVRGDWGDLCEEDAEANKVALNDGSRLLSAYTLNDDIKIWIITEAANDNGLRAATTILLPEEY